MTVHAANPSVIPSPWQVMTISSFDYTVVSESRNKIRVLTLGSTFDWDDGIDFNRDIEVTRK